MLKDNELNIEAFTEGKLACENSIENPQLGTNPYEKNTIKWYSWNRGWNSVII